MIWLKQKSMMNFYQRIIKCALRAQLHCLKFTSMFRTRRNLVERKIRKILRENGPIKGSALKDSTKGKAKKRTTIMTTHKFVTDVVVLIIVQRNTELPSIWLNCI